MQRGLIAVLAAAAVSAACLFTLRLAVGGGLDEAGIVLAVAAATLVLALAAAAFALGALMKASLAEQEARRLARSVDAALRDLSDRSDRGAVRLDEINAFVTRELELLSAGPRLRPSESTASRGKVVPINQARKQRAEAPSGEPAAPSAPIDEAAGEAASADATASGFEDAIADAVAAGGPSLSLLPIVSIADGAAAGFEVHAHIVRGDGQSADIRRLADALPRVPLATFERWLLVGAIDAVQTGLGSNGGLSLHVQISDALLTSDDDLGILTERLKAAGPHAQAIVVSLPAASVERKGRGVEAIEVLRGAGARIAAEGWAGTRESLERLAHSGVSVLKLPAPRLLGRTKLPRMALSTTKLVEACAASDLKIIALQVDADEDAVSLIDLGITLMTGSRFAKPMRLRSGLAHEQPERTAAAQS